MSANGPRSDAGESRNGGSNRNGRTERPRVQQLRPTNKEIVQPVRQQPVVAQTESTRSTAQQQQDEQQAQQAQERAGAAAPRVVPRIVTGQGSGSTIIVNSLQKGNPVVKYITNIGWEYGDIVPDYQVGVAACALFLSLRYHQLHPEYIHNRINKLGNMYTLRILLVLCDTEQPDKHIKELTKVALVNKLTIMVAWSSEEVASYLERYKAFEHKSPDLIRERINDDYMSHLTSALTSITGVNKTDVVTLATNFGSMRNIAFATSDQFAQCPGFGEIKVRRIIEAFNQPFRVGETRTGRERRAEREAAITADDAVQSIAQSAGRDTNDRRLTPSTGIPRPTLPPLIDEFDQQTSRSINRSDIAAAPQPALQPPSFATIGSSKNGNEAVDDEIQDADEFGDILDGLTEEEQLQLAMEMSISGGADNLDAGP